MLIETVNSKVNAVVLAYYLSDTFDVAVDMLYGDAISVGQSGSSIQGTRSVTAVAIITAAIGGKKANVD